MKKKNWIIDVRYYLDEPHMSHLYAESLKTEDVNELKALLRRAVILNDTFIQDAKTYLTDSEEL